MLPFPHTSIFLVCANRFVYICKKKAVCIFQYLTPVTTLNSSNVLEFEHTSYILYYMYLGEKWQGIQSRFQNNNVSYYNLALSSIVNAPQDLIGNFLPLEAEVTEDPV